MVSRSHALCKLCASMLRCSTWCPLSLLMRESMRRLMMRSNVTIPTDCRCPTGRSVSDAQARDLDWQLQRMGEFLTTEAHFSDDRVAEMISRIDTKSLQSASNESDWVPFLQLVFLAVVQSDHKEDFLEPMMNLEGDTPAVMMSLLTEVMQLAGEDTEDDGHDGAGHGGRGSDGGSSAGGRSPRRHGRSRRGGSHASEDDGSSEGGLRRQVASLREELEDARFQKDKVEQELEDLRFLRSGESSSAGAGRSAAQSRGPSGFSSEEFNQEMLEELQETLQRKEVEVERLREELRSQEGQWQMERAGLKEEIDILHSRADRASQLEASLSKAQSRLDGVQQLRDSLQESKEEIQRLQDANTRLKSDVESMDSVREQLDSLRDRVVDLETAKRQAEARAQAKGEQLSKAEEERTQLQDAKRFAEEGKRAAESQLAALRASIGSSDRDAPASAKSHESWREGESLADFSPEGGKGATAADTGEAIAPPPSGEADAQEASSSSSLRLQLEEERQVSARMQQRLAQLEQELSDARSVSQSGSTVEELQRDLEAAQTGQRAAEEEAGRVRASLLDARAAASTVDHLKETLKERQHECDALKDRSNKLEAYVRKLTAKSREVQAAEAQKTADAVAAREHLKEELQELKQKKERELTLMATAVFELGRSRVRDLLRPGAAVSGGESAGRTPTFLHRERSLRSPLQSRGPSAMAALGLASPSAIRQRRRTPSRTEGHAT